MKTENWLTCHVHAFHYFGGVTRLLIPEATRQHSPQRVFNRLIHSARFAVPSASAEGIEYYEYRKLDKTLMLRFSTCKALDHEIRFGNDNGASVYDEGGILLNTRMP